MAHAVKKESRGSGGTVYSLPALTNRKKVRVIRQDQLEEFRDLLLARDSLRKRLKEIEADVEGYNALLVEYLKRDDVSIEKGPLTGTIKIRSGRKSVSKDHIIAKLGPKTYAELLNTAPKTPDKEIFEVLKRVE